ncbi:hypothetical protein RND71_037989 [Anisodus tanguticus]|uniref:RRM domain-containing protein n=1 Tax=Anisodus tanguticus TaxID=243964 RepID=A0AAE1URR9_9SOLA|nr:hypothetical protein RND71_037989 [Anisodus tanguticus]
MAADAQVCVIEAPALQSNTDTEFSEQNVNCESVVPNNNNNGVKDDAISNVNNNKMEDIIVDMMLKKLKLNPMAKEFVPSYHNNFVPLIKTVDAADAFPNNAKRGNNYNQGRRRMNNRAFKAQREDSIRRTVYVSDIDQNITEEHLAAIFSAYGQVVDCRVCGDPHSRLRFAFVEFADEYSARASLSLCGTILGFSPLKVLPSKTAILPVNPTFLPRSEDEREMCARTVYCTNIDKKVSQADVKNFFETRCGEVSRLRLLGDQVHSTRIAFVEFVMAESAILALDCCGQILGSQRIRVSPSKTPVRPRVPRPVMH